MMKNKMVLLSSALAAVLLAAGVYFFVIQPRGRAGEIGKMARSGAKENEILSVIDKSSGRYSLSADDIVALKKDGVSDDVIVAMLNHNRNLATKDTK